MSTQETPPRRAEFAQRLNQILDERNIAPKGAGRVHKVAELFGEPASTVAKWLSGRSYPEIDRLIDMSVRLDVSIDYLLRGEIGLSGNAASQSIVNIIRIRRLTDSGDDFIYVDRKHLHQEECSGNAIAILNYSSSMERTIQRNATVIAIPEDGIKHEGIYAFRYFHATLIRRVTFGVNGNLRLTCDNDNHSDVIELSPSVLDDPASQVTVIGRVTRVYCLSV